MGFRQGAYATIWETKTGNGNYTEVRLSTSKKNKQTNEYETDFSGFVRFIGNAHSKASTLKAKDKIKLGECEVTNSYSKEKNTTYTNFLLFTFDSADSANNNSKPTSSATVSNAFVNIPDGLDDDSLPFN